MKMTKALTITWVASNDPIATKLSVASRLFMSMGMCLENKTLTHQAITVDNRSIYDGSNTVKQFFADQAAVEEYLNFCKILESRYQTKIDKIEITDI
jgi:hypothetical protein